MPKGDYRRNNGKFAPTIDRQRRLHNAFIGSLTDRLLREKDKKGPQKGPRALFLDELDKGGYEPAKKIIQDRYGEDAFSDEVFEGWIEEAGKNINREEDYDGR